jgi:hypothetical protein
MSLRLLLLGSAALTLALLGGPREASACGGLFCSSSSPVNQAAERIVFAKNDDGTVSAVIEILYEGPSEQFAWVLPVPAQGVVVDFSSKQTLDALQQASNPSYTLQSGFADGCEVPRSTSGAVADLDGNVVEEESAGAVSVVASGTVGPYDYVQISVNPDDDDPAQAAVDWLEENGYDVGALGPDVLRPYLAAEMNLLAVRLSKGNDTGSIRPLHITYPGERPLIPIRPTAVAANENMGILVWVLGNARAVPTSYLHLELNDARIDWFDPNPTYNDVVNRAADEAGGQGFVTEQAGPAGAFADVVLPTWKEDQWTQLRTGEFATMQAFLEMAQAVAQSHFYPSFSGFGGPLGDSAVSFEQNQYDGFLDVLSDPEIVPLREGATAEQLNGCVACYFQEDVAVANDLYPSTPFDPVNDPLLTMDVSAFLDAMQELVIDPLLETRALFETHAYATRLYTTMSADEMDTDPEFDLNPDLEDVSNVHTATRVFECNGNDWTITLPSGLELTGSGSTWPIGLDDEVMPFNVRVLQLSTSGEGDVVLDNTDLVVSRLADLGLSEALPEPGPGGVGLDDPSIEDPEDEPGASEDPEVVDDEGSGPDTEPANAARTSDDGCAVVSVGGRAGTGQVVALAGLLLCFARRRRG